MLNQKIQKTSPTKACKSHDMIQKNTIKIDKISSGKDGYVFFSKGDYFIIPEKEKKINRYIKYILLKFKRKLTR